MILERINITNHAWRQFILRSIIRYEALPACPMSALRTIMQRALPEDLGSGAVKRLLDNRLQPARYFIFNNWRLVCTEDLSRLLTVEIAIFHNRQRRARKRRRSH